MLDFIREYEFDMLRDIFATGRRQHGVRQLFANGRLALGTRHTSGLLVSGGLAVRGFAVLVESILVDKPPLANRASRLHYIVRDGWGGHGRGSSVTTSVI
jgi:hypothetical protein